MGLDRNGVTRDTGTSGTMTVMGLGSISYLESPRRQKAPGQGKNASPPATPTHTPLEDTAASQLAGHFRQAADWNWASLRTRHCPALPLEEAHINQ